MTRVVYFTTQFVVNRRGNDKEYHKNVFAVVSSIYIPVYTCIDIRDCCCFQHRAIIFIYLFYFLFLFFVAVY